MKKYLSAECSLCHKNGTNLIWCVPNIKQYNFKSSTEDTAAPIYDWNGPVGGIDYIPVLRTTTELQITSDITNCPPQKLCETCWNIAMDFIKEKIE